MAATPTMDQTLHFLGFSTLIAASLVMVSILLGLVTSRAGMPLLLIFLAMGMLAGEDGPGGIVFNNHQLSFWIANIALAVILLDGGLRTSRTIFRVALKPALTLATVGVVLSCLVLTLFAVLFFDLPILVAFLFGAIVSSTDAAAVFGLLKNAGFKLNERVESTLEIESGINDPMAIFLTIIAITFLINDIQSVAQIHWADLIWMVIQQAGIGLVLAYLLGYGFTRLLRKMRVDHSHNHGLNALLILAAGLAVFGLSTMLGGSGFLSIYIFGLIVANEKPRFVKTIIPAMDGLAWLFQASMFLLLGLLATPSAVMNSLLDGLGLALLLMFVVRPLTVFPCLLPFRYSFKEMLFVSWVGLRGAVPIVLAIFPIIAGVDDQRLMLDMALLVVITSLLMQGSTISLLAKKLGLALPDASDPNAVRKTFGSLALDGLSPMKDVAVFYDLDIAGYDGMTLNDWIRMKLGKPPVVGDVVMTPTVTFVVRVMHDDQIVKVGTI